MIMSELRIAVMDHGGANARILAKESKADFRRVEAASLKMPVRFGSAEGKRFFVRYFSTLQLNSHFISTIARTVLDHADVAKVELALREQVDALNEKLNKAIDGAEVLFKLHAVTTVATYDTVALEGEVGVMSSLGRRFLEGITKLDQLMPLLQTLEIHDVISPQAVDNQRSALKRQVRNVATAARGFALGLRRRMNAQARQVADTDAAGSDGSDAAALVFEEHVSTEARLVETDAAQGGTVDPGTADSQPQS
jgi:hypothetical protein